MAHPPNDATMNIRIFAADLIFSDPTIRDAPVAPANLFGKDQPAGMPGSPAAFLILGFRSFSHNPGVFNAIPGPLRLAYNAAFNSFNQELAPHIHSHDAEDIRGGGQRGSMTWAKGRRCCIRLLRECIQNNIPNDVRLDNRLADNCGARTGRTNESQTVKIALFVIAVYAFGGGKIKTCRGVCSLNTLAAMDGTHGNCVKHMFVIPLVHLLVLSLPATYDCREIPVMMNEDLAHMEEHWAKQIKTKGIWSKFCMAERVRNNTIHDDHKHDCKGMECTFVRVLEQVSPLINRSNPKSQVARQVMLRSTTELERMTRRTHHSVGCSPYKLVR